MRRRNLFLDKHHVPLYITFHLKVNPRHDLILSAHGVPQHIKIQKLHLGNRHIHLASKHLGKCGGCISRSNISKFF
jgi:hypothetical protein